MKVNSARNMKRKRKISYLAKNFFLFLVLVFIPVFDFLLQDQGLIAQSNSTRNTLVDCKSLYHTQNNTPQSKGWALNPIHTGTA